MPAAVSAGLNSFNLIFPHEIRFADAVRCRTEEKRTENKFRFGLADVPLAQTNACFEGKNGHDAGVTPFPASRIYR
jgi:hypothetical protein